ncbi:MAG: 30S ribosomal protein S16 [Bacteroidota bacterium]|nr:30S ribosomal protein S16 [Bacteroidota bacterium]MDP4230297.1 30S ribosomal protein S16 [Bacteroidota bacterium]MDP4235616.1 30S ribosomal protein S16 [Bacteroidota bacterium]
MVKLRLAKQGRKKLPIYKIVAADSRNRRDGRFIEALGQYRPQNETGKVQLNEDRIMYWLNVGAQPTDTMRSILSKEGILLKWHLEKKKVDPARAQEIFNTWKSEKQAQAEKKQMSKADSAKKKKAEAEAIKAEAARAEAQKAADAAAAAQAVADAAAEAEAAATPVAEAPSIETPAAE